MGVDYSYSVGYGVKLPEEALKSWWERQGNDPEDFWPSEAMETVKFPEGLGFIEAGNLMNGEEANLIVVSRLTESFEMYEMDDTIHFFNDIEVYTEEEKLLRGFVYSEFFIDAQPGFFAAGRIS